MINPSVNSQKLPLEIVNKILEKKAELESTPIYEQYSLKDKSIMYKINKFAIQTKLDTINLSKQFYRPTKIFVDFLQYDLTDHPIHHSSMSIQYKMKNKQNNDTYYYITTHLNSRKDNPIYIFLKYYNNFFHHGWVCTDKLYPICSKIKLSQIGFYPNTIYPIISFTVSPQNTKYHFCSCFNYSFDSNYFMNYDETDGKYAIEER